MHDSHASLPAVANPLSTAHADSVTRYRVETWQLLLALALLALCFQGTRGLWERDEGRYASMAVQMLDSGDWWLPSYNVGEPHLAKPPLTYWLIAGSMKLFGYNEWAVRLPFAVAFVLTGLAVMIVARQLGFQRPWFAAMLWATSALPFFGGNVVMPDPLLALFETAAMAAFLLAGGAMSQRLQRRWSIAMWLAFGLAFVTKGPPALLPLLAIAVWLGWQRRWNTLRTLFAAPGVSLFVLLGFGWYAELAYRYPELVRYFLGYEFVDRVFTATHHRNSDWLDMFYVYGPTLLLGALPWWPALLLRRVAIADSDATRSVRTFLWCWIAVPLSIFALSRSRLPHYVLPLFVPIALALAHHIEHVAVRSQIRLIRFAAVWCLLLIGVKAALGHVPAKVDARELSNEVHALSARLSQPLRKIVYVEHPPAYGIRFYLQVPVSGAVLSRETSQFASGEVFQSPSVCEQAQTREAILWLVPPALGHDFTEQLARCGFTPRLLAPKLRKWLPYEVTASAR